MRLVIAVLGAELVRLELGLVGRAEAAEPDGVPGTVASQVETGPTFGFARPLPGDVEA